MTTYNVSLRTWASTTITVDAESPQAAIDAALNAEMPWICAKCAGMGSDDRNLELGDEWEPAVPEGTPETDAVWVVTP